MQELRDLRESGASLAEIVEYFLKKDADMRSYARRRARLEAQAKVKFLKSSFFPIFLRPDMLNF